MRYSRRIVNEDFERSARRLMRILKEHGYEYELDELGAIIIDLKNVRVMVEYTDDDRWDIFKDNGDTYQLNYEEVVTNDVVEYLKKYEGQTLSNESRRPHGHVLKEDVEYDERVGNQNFTVSEFHKAWKELERKVKNDERIYDNEAILFIQSSDNDYSGGFNAEFDEGEAIAIIEDYDSPVDVDVCVHYRDEDDNVEWSEHYIRICDGEICDVY